MSPSPFNWLAFLLGFAIALWIAVVLLFIVPKEDPASPEDRPVYAQPPSQASRPVGALWVPNGDDAVFCTNNDAGGGYVEDAGGGYVEDVGGGYVDDVGGGYVDDTTPRTPVPSKDFGDVYRDLKEYHCETNDVGGGYVEDMGSRSVAQPMQAKATFFCWKDALGNATVLRTEGEGNARAYWRIKLSKNQKVVLYDMVEPAAGSAVGIPAANQVEG
ncbi:MAG: hypothetical protein WBM40_10910, partial [Thiohalocapsa sp.]